MSAIVSPVVRTPLPCQLCKQLCTMQCGVPVQRWLCWVHTLHRLEKEHLPGGFTECLLQLCFNTAPPLLIHSENPSHMMCPPQILSGQDSVTHSRLEFYGRPPALTLPHNGNFQPGNTCFLSSCSSAASNILLPVSMSCADSETSPPWGHTVLVLPDGLVHTCVTYICWNDRNLCDLSDYCEDSSERVFTWCSSQVC